MQGGWRESDEARRLLFSCIFLAFFMEERVRVVVADDEPITRLDLIEMLKSQDFEVVGEASDGFDTIELCREVHPDVVLMDVKMPLLDGISAAGCIRKERLADAVILLTAFTDEEFINRAKDCGVSVYLIKPVDVRVLAPNIAMAVARGREQRKLEKEVEEANQRLEDRKFIERAKAKLIKDNRMQEQEAFDYIRQVSKDKRISMKKVAELILMNS